MVSKVLRYGLIVVHVKPFLIYGKTPEEDNALEDYFKITLQLIKYILYKYKMNGGDIMIGQKIKGLLILDLYVEKLNLAIEYDGKPHFTPIDWAGKGINWAIENLKLAEYRDNIKDKACYDRGIFLLRIPYTRKDNFKEMINEVIDIILK